MNIFTSVSGKTWNDRALSRGVGSVLLTSSWEDALEPVFPYISFGWYQYRDTHLVRVAQIGNRITTVPFAEGGDILPIGEALLDIVRFNVDVATAFGEGARLRVNERFCPVTNAHSYPVGAKEHVLTLRGNLHEHVRKTLRHILGKPLPGHIEKVTAPQDATRAYHLYLRHMRRVANIAMPHNAFQVLTAIYKGNLFVWKNSGRVHAMVLFLSGASEALYALGASDKTGFRAHAAHHLVHHALEQYRREGLRSVSLGTTGVDSALETFKRGWRGMEYATYTIGGAQHKRLRTSPFRALARLIPLQLYERASSVLGKYLF
jgi:hypothetical protein